MECVDTFPFKRQYPYVTFRCHGNVALYILNLYQYKRISHVKYENNHVYVTLYDYGDTHYMSGKLHFPIIDNNTLVGTYDYDVDYIPERYLDSNLYEVNNDLFIELDMPRIEFNQTEYEHISKRQYDEPIETDIIEPVTDNDSDIYDDNDNIVPIYFSDLSDEDV